MIGSTQNSDRQIERLAAQRQLYSTAKVLLGWQVILGGPVAALTAFLALRDPSIKGYVAGWGLLIVILDIFWLTPWQRRIRNSAAKIQEAFDCDVLQLPWNELRTGRPPDPELVKEYSDDYATIADSMPPLTNWYAPAVDELPIHVGRIACQRANCWWDAKQRRRYANVVVALVTVLTIGALVLSLRGRMSIEDFLLGVAAPLAPALLLGVRQYIELIESASRLDQLKEHSERLWNEALSGVSKAKIESKSRALQDEIFDNRRKSPLVFDIVFRLLRDRLEDQMNFGTEHLVAQARGVLGVHTK